MDYDIVIIGGGISGLYCGYNLIKKHKILILERDDRLGGRINTIYNNKFKIESGAGRFTMYNKRLIKLLKELNILNIGKNNSNKDIISNKNCTFKNQINAMINKLSILDKNTLQKNNLKTLIIDNFSISFYTCLLEIYEKNTLFTDINAYDSLRYLKGNYNENRQFYSHKNGLSSIINKLEELFIKNGGTILRNHELINFDESNNIFTLFINGKVKVIETKNLIITAGKKALSNYSYLKPFNDLINSINLTPLYRIYMKYPLKNGKVWFSEIKRRVIYHSLIKYIIPINLEKGVIMISYTAGKDATKLYQYQLKNKLEDIITKELKKIFKNIEIPLPEKTFNYYWYNGVSKWKIGINSDKVSKKILQPFDDINLFICGECYSLNQGWMEGALETSDKVINKINKNFKKIRSKKGKISRKISLNEVKKHNTKDNSWMIINNKVLDVTHWIDRHPGGNIIMKGIGKDATNYFNNSNHSSGAKNKLKKCVIGELC